MIAPLSLEGLARRIRERGVEVDVHGDASVEVARVCLDSRKVVSGDLFCAVSGSNDDGARYIADAAAAGAAAVLCKPAQAPAGLAALVTSNTRRALGAAASIVAGEPTLTLDLLGVTGTNGKTTTCYLIESIVARAGRRPGLLGTIVHRCAAFERSASLTTPPADELHRVLAEMLEAGCDTVAMEVSSHALDQRRVEGCRFRGGVFTNLTRDHLDYHGDEERYFGAKALLFREYLDPGGAFAVLNADDERVAALAHEMHSAEVWTYSLDPGSSARVRVIDAAVDLDGIDATIDLDGRRLRISSRMIGRPNLSNILAACAVGAALGIADEAIARGVADCPAVPGRLERVDPRRPCVLVDYAHTPDALARSIAAASEHARGRVVCVFGCGGDRDRGKRPMMAEAVAGTADLAVVTSDNPRTEDAGAIIDDVVAGMRAAGAMAPVDPALLAQAVEPSYAIEPDRRAAIELAVAAAGEDDVVVVAGKGHENYQDVAGVRRHFDDREEVARAMELRHGR